MLANRVQERIELSDVVAMALPASPLGVQVSQVAFEHGSVEVGQGGDSDVVKEGREAGQ